MYQWKANSANLSKREIRNARFNWTMLTVHICLVDIAFHLFKQSLTGVERRLHGLTMPFVASYMWRNVGLQ